MYLIKFIYYFGLEMYNLTRKIENICQEKKVARIFFEEGSNFLIF